MTEAEWLSSTDPAAMLDHLRGKVSDRKLRLFAVACCRRIWHLLTDDAHCSVCSGNGLVYQDEYRGYGDVQSVEVRCTACSGTGRINRSQRAVEAAERYADGLITVGELAAARDAAWAAATWDAARDATWDAARAAAWAAAWAAASDAARAAASDAARAAAWDAARAGARDAEKRQQATLLRDIIGNPFRPATLAVNPDWLYWHQGGGHGRIDMVQPIKFPDLAHWLAWNDGTIPRLAEAIYQERAFDRMPILADALEDAGCTNQEILNHCRQLNEHVRGCWVVDLFLGKR